MAVMVARGENMIIRRTPKFGTQKLKTSYCLWPRTVSQNGGESVTYWLQKTKVLYVFEPKRNNDMRRPDQDRSKGHWVVKSVRPV